MIVYNMSFTTLSNAYLSLTTATEAKSFLLEKGYFNDNSLLPKIINPRNLDEINLSPINWTKAREIPRTFLIKLISSKGDKGLRVHGLIHPKLYLHLVEEITDEPFWEAIKDKLTATTNVDVYTLPQFTDDAIESQKTAWAHFDKIDYHANSIGFDVLYQADIQNFYGSVYTHAISWAILGKDVAKSTHGLHEPANRLDKLMQNANDGQTNGIPIGNEISNILAELILKDIDKIISPTVQETGSIAMRYRDDYKFLCKTTGDANKVHSALAEALNEYGLALNTTKTRSSSVFGHDTNIKDKHISDSAFNRHWRFKSDEEAEIDGAQLYYAIASIVDMSRYGIDRRLLNSYLSRIILQLSEEQTKLASGKEWAHPTVGLLIGLNDNAPVNVSYIFALIDNILHAYKQDDPRDVELIVNQIISHYASNSSILLNIWIYLLCLKTSSSLAGEFLESQSTEIFNMIKNPMDDNVSSYRQRDPINAADLNELGKFKLIDMSILDSVEASDEPISIDFLDAVFGGEWLSSHYDG